MVNHCSILGSPEVQRATSEMHGKVCGDVSSDLCVNKEEAGEHVKIGEVTHDEVSRQCEDLRTELASLQSATESAHSDNARLQVQVATLQSRITALSAQHTALQVANTQLVAEKDEVCFTYRTKM